MKYLRTERNDEFGIRDCFLTHHKGHKDLTFDGQNSCKFVKFVAEHTLKGVLTK